MGDFEVRRKLPLIGDIVSRLREASPDADIYIYTNVDIALIPHFYLSVYALMQQKDAIVINRRTIPAIYDAVEQLDLMYPDVGTSHRGFDCFVFRSELMGSLQLGHSLIGAPWVGTTMLCNLAQNPSSLTLLKDPHLTFHIGNDRAWRRPEYEDYRVHDRREFHKVAEEWSASSSELQPLVAKMHGYALLQEAKSGPKGLWRGIGRLPARTRKRIWRSTQSKV